MSQIYVCNDVDSVIICGDINARVGNLNDYVQLVDELSDRIIVDVGKNKHGQVFIDFLHESKMCVGNGRVPGSDNFTCISTKGKSVVDYIAINHDGLENCSEWKVFTPIDMLSDLNLQMLVSRGCKPSDHSVVMMTYSTNSIDTHSVPSNNREDTPEQCVQSDIYSNFVKGKKVCYNSIPDSFLLSETWQQKLETFQSEIDDRLYELCNQDDIDMLYDKFCEAMFKEIEKEIQIKEISKQGRKRFKYHKPFWNDELTTLWKAMRDAEKLFNSYKGANSQYRQRYRKEFVDARHQFDKKLRSTERSYYKKFADNLESINTNNPKEFWDHIKNLGPRKKMEIPMRVYSPEGEILSDKPEVLKKWKDEFWSLYNANNEINFDNQFYEEILLEKCNLENLENPNENNSLNSCPSENELRRLIRKLKNRKSVGPDCIPNEIIKSGKIDGFLLKLFRTCFNNGIAPSIWSKSIIVPIPKNALSDPCVPLNYRGISLLSCIYKLYTSLLNERLVKHTDANNLIADEQNGFRKDRSCLDHIFSLTSIIRNRKSKNLDTFCAFIDYQKAFDWVNKDMLLFKLLKFFKLRGKIYDAIKCLLMNSVAKVRINQMYTDWFSISSGVRQGDTLSPTLFSMYINDLAQGINNLACGIDIDNFQTGILLYADDVVIIAPDEEKLQRQLNFVYQWCQKWRLLINKSKSQVIHFRKKGKSKSETEFVFGDEPLKIVTKYKYLGVILDEFLDYRVTAEVLADAGGRALGGIIHKLQPLRDVRYETFKKLFETCVKPISNYAAAIWAYKYTERVPCYKGE